MNDMKECKCKKLLKFAIAAYATVGQLVDYCLCVWLVQFDRLHPEKMWVVIEFIVSLLFFCGMCYALWRWRLLYEGFFAFVFFL